MVHTHRYPPPGGGDPLHTAAVLMTTSERDAVAKVRPGTQERRGLVNVICGLAPPSDPQTCAQGEPHSFQTNLFSH